MPSHVTGLIWRAAVVEVPWRQVCTGERRWRSCLPVATRAYPSSTSANVPEVADVRSNPDGSLAPTSGTCRLACLRWWRGRAGERPSSKDVEPPRRNTPRATSFPRRLSRKGLVVGASAALLGVALRADRA